MIIKYLKYFQKIFCKYPILQTKLFIIYNKKTISMNIYINNITISYIILIKMKNCIYVHNVNKKSYEQLIAFLFASFFLIS